MSCYQRMLAQRSGGQDPAATQMQDFLLNLLVVFLCLISGSVVLAKAKASDDSGDGPDSKAHMLFFATADTVRVGTPAEPPVTLEKAVLDLREQLARPEATRSVYIIHPADALSGDVHAVLRAVNRIDDIHTYLELDPASSALNAEGSNHR